MPEAARHPEESAPASSMLGVAELVQSLALVMQHAGVTELDLSLGSVDIRLRRPANHAGQSGRPAEDNDEADVSGTADPGHVVTAPMVGTFYTAPTPGAPPFVAEGDEIMAGQTIGIIEAMKIMNEVTADHTGVVLEILVRNGQPVEYGSSLIRLGPRFERS